MARRVAVADPPAASNGRDRTALTAAAVGIGKRSIALEVQAPGRIARAQAWQDEVIGYADALGAIGYGVGQMSGAMAKARWFIATREDPKAEPVDAVEAGVALAEEAAATLARLDNSPQGLSGLTAEGAWNWQVPGEFYIVGEGTNADTTRVEQWDVRSVKEVSTMPGRDPETGEPMDIVSVLDYEGSQPRKLDPNDSFVSRIWKRHPVYGWQATSHMRALRTECDEYLILSRSIRGSGRSRTNAGLLLLPSGLKVVPLNTVDDATPGRGAQTLGDDLMEGFLIPIADEGSAGSVVPMMIEGDKDLLDKVRHLTLDRPIDPIAAGQRQELIQRINEGMNWPVEIGSGLGGSNHWSAWAITESMFDSHVAPELSLLAQGLWTGVVRPLFIETLVTGHGMSEEAAFAATASLFLWYDGSALISKPNVVGDIVSAANAVYPIVNGAYARKALGASEEDAPTPEELDLRAAYIAATAGRRIGATLPGEDIGPPPAVPAPEAPGTPPRAQTTASAVTAAARPRASKRAKLGAKLAAIDKALFTRLEAAASAALTRALERAGNRIRGKVQRDKTTAAVVAAGVPSVDVAATLGRAMVAAAGFADPDLLDGSFDDLLDQVDGWTARAQAQSRTAIAQAEGIDPSELTDMAAAQDDHRAESLAWFGAALATVAAARLYDPHPAAPPLGEHDPSMTVPPGLIRETMARAGGAQGTADADGPTGGLATGPDIRSFLNDNGANLLGWTWSYGDSEREFPAHVDLDGVAFASWDDDQLAVQAGDEWVDGGIPGYYAPADHNGCACWAEPMYADDSGGDTVTEGDAG